MCLKTAGSRFVPSSRPIGDAIIEVCGDDLVCVKLGDTNDAASLAEALRAATDLVEIVPGIDSVVVQFDAAQVDSATIEGQLRAIIDAGVDRIEGAGDLVEIPVVYGGAAGPDFDRVCEQTGLSPDELIALHSGCEYSVELVGFTPGFAFIGGLDDALNVPRRHEPRQQVAAGSVGIADGRTGLYALPVPGGWQLIGRTDAALFDADRDPPNLLNVGDRVLFVAAGYRR